MSRSVLPYLVASREAVEKAAWSMLRDDDWVELPEALADWDYNTDLRLRSSWRISSDEFTATTQLPADVLLRWAVSCRAIDGMVGFTAVVQDLRLSEGCDSGVLDVTLPGEHLGAVVELRTRLTLAEHRATSSPGVATLAGSILWSETVTVALAGDLARFPVAVVDFAASGLDPEASWTLEIPADLSVPVLGGLLLLINQRDLALVEAVNRAPAGELVAALSEDVAVELLRHAVDFADLLLAEEWEEGSLGYTMMMLASRYEGGLRALSELREGRPAAFRASLVGLARRSGLGRALP